MEGPYRSAHVEAVATDFRPPRQKACFFDPQRRAANASLGGIIRNLAFDLASKEKALGLRERSRSRRDAHAFALSVEAIACNLLVLRMVGSDRPLAVPKSSAAMWGSTRSVVYGAHFLAALEIMAHPQVELIEEVSKGHKFAGNQGYLSSIRALPKLSVLIPDATDWASFKRDETAEVLILKGRKVGGIAETLNFRETSKTVALRREVVRLNAWLAKAPIFIERACPHWGDDDQLVDPTKRSLRRIFNNGKWTEGGRLYDGFWETMPKVDREAFLRIGTESQPYGERIRHVDFGQLFARLAYTKADAKAPDGDMYDVFPGRATRSGVKVLLNALLFSTGPLRQWPRGVSKAFPGISLKEAIVAIADKHAPIKHLFGTGVGHNLMFVESEILLDVLRDLRRLGISALPLHDAVIVAASNAEKAREVMENHLLSVLPNETRAAVSVE